MKEESNAGSRRRFLNRLTAMTAFAFLGLSKTNGQHNEANIIAGVQKKVVIAKSLKDYKLSIRSDGQKAKTLLNELIALIEQMPDDKEQVKGNRQQYETVYENFDQKSSQLMSILSSIIKSEREVESSIIRNIR